VDSAEGGTNSGFSFEGWQERNFTNEKKGGELLAANASLRGGVFFSGRVTVCADPCRGEGAERGKGCPLFGG